MAESPVTEMLAGLNPEQRAAVTHEGGPLLVLAGAGTGKTTVITSRVAWLIGQGVPADRILLLTFTRRAAREMLARTRALVDAGADRGVVGGTFHSVAHRLIRVHAAALGLPPRFGVLDGSDAADLLAYILSFNKFPTGKTDLPSDEDSLKKLTLPKPAPKA